VVSFSEKIGREEGIAAEVLVRTFTCQHHPEPMLSRESRKAKLAYAVEVNAVMFAMIGRVGKIFGQGLFIHALFEDLHAQPVRSSLCNVSSTVSISSYISMDPTPTRLVIARAFRELDAETPNTACRVLVSKLDAFLPDQMRHDAGDYGGVDLSG
jgi:hypothetical protein